ncbi:hypothetical protein B0J17DRAFT_631930 [Rhizoctonia solani]|nr:hypothetical protein B0J17DRAFT_631930 [Rhizoctonia solani]
MSSDTYSPEHHKLRTDLTTAREQLSAALDRYAGVCLNIRNTHHQASAKDAQLPGFPSSELVSELPILSLLEWRLHEATQNLTRAYELGQARTSRIYPPPIDKLPDELLAQIFRHVVASQPRNIYPTAVAFPRYPNTLARTSILDHTKQYVQGTGHLPLELHITDLGNRIPPDLDSHLDDLQQFLASIARRTKSLEVARSNPSLSTIESEVFATILRGSSEMLTKVVIHSKGLTYPRFIGRPNQFDEDEESVAQEIDLSREQIERSLARLTVLHASQVYLIGQAPPTTGCISPSEFLAILNASSGLRILHFGINLGFSRDDTTMNNATVRLEDLEVLHLTANGFHGPEDTEHEIQRIMQHNAPGSKPLHLTLNLAGYQDPTPIEAMKTFFSRSHVVKFCAKAGNPPPVTLLDCAPHLTHLVFDHCRYDVMYDLNQARSQLTSLESWAIRGTPIFIEDLSPLVKQDSARSVVMSNCPLFSKEGGPVEIPESELGEWGFQVPDNARYFNPDPLPDPTADWNSLY